MKDCAPCPVDVFPLYKKSCPTTVVYDQPDRNPRPGKKCGSIDTFTLVRKPCKTVVYNKPCYTSKILLVTRTLECRWCINYTEAQVRL